MPRRLVVTTLLLGLGLTAAFAAPQEASPVALRIDILSWLSGSWTLTRGERVVEEQWMSPSGGAMLGMSRTVRAGKMTEFEFLRIEQRGSDLVYVAQPQGRPATDFKAIKVSASEVVFENLQHDFPQQILYTRNPDGSVTAKVQGPGKDGKPRAFTFDYQRAK